MNNLPAIEAREVAARLRSIQGAWISPQDIYWAVDNSLFYLDNGDSHAFRDKLCDLLEAGADETCMTFDDVVDSLRQVRDAVERIDPEREDAADWVMEQGGLEEIKYHYNFMVTQMAARVGITPGEHETEQVTIGRILDELDKRLMPPGMEWPRFEDGEKIGWDYEPEEFTSKGFAFNGLLFRREYVELCAFGVGRICRSMQLEYGERVKRPEPKLLGSDGLPLEKGQTVFFSKAEYAGSLCLNGFEPNDKMTVVDICPKETPQITVISDGPLGYANPEMLTHVQQFFGSDGLPIAKGETVYLDAEHAKIAGSPSLSAYHGCDLSFVGPHQGLVVDTFSADGSAYFANAEPAWCPASWLTHTSPDTQERIDADKKKWRSTYWGCGDASCDECPSLIDGKKPYEYYGVNGCVIAQGMDIARREQELKERTGCE